LRCGKRTLVTASRVDGESSRPPHEGRSGSQPSATLRPSG
jgi:hypothetical protein